MSKATENVFLGVMGLLWMLALVMIGTICYLVPAFAVILGIIVIVHIPIVLCAMGFIGTDEEREAIRNYHPPGHE